jgi:hypothetical protein
MTAEGRFDSFDQLHSNGRFRRILLLAAHPGEGRFTQPTAAVQSWRPELVFMPQRRPLPRPEDLPEQVGKQSFDQAASFMSHRGITAKADGDIGLSSTTRMLPSRVMNWLQPRNSG